MTHLVGGLFIIQVASCIECNCNPIPSIAQISLSNNHVFVFDYCHFHGDSMHKSAFYTSKLIDWLGGILFPPDAIISQPAPSLHKIGISAKKIQVVCLWQIHLTMYRKSYWPVAPWVPVIGWLFYNYTNRSNGVPDWQPLNPNHWPIKPGSWEGPRLNAKELP